MARASHERDAFALYMQDVRATGPLLTAEEERDLARRARAGDATARERLVTANLRLAANRARRFWTLFSRYGECLDLVDMIQHANVGLLTAASKFDPDRGTRFSTHATWWIDQSLRRAHDNEAHTVRRPTHFNAFVYALRRAERALESAVGDPPTDEALAAHLKVSVRKVMEARHIVKPLVSLDRPLGEDGNELSTLIPADIIGADVLAEESAWRLLVNLAFGALDPREREVLRRRLGLGVHEKETLEQVGDAFGLTRERVRQIERTALRRLREKLRSAEASRRVLTAARRHCTACGQDGHDRWSCSMAFAALFTDGASA